MEICLLLDDPSCAELLKVVTPTIAKRNTCEKQSLPLSVYILQCAVGTLEMV